MTDLPNDVETLKAIIKQLLEENAQLKAENTELRRRLGLDSTNSSKPPSSNGYKKKPIAPAIPKNKHPKGGQKGHKGNTLHRVANPDHIELHLPQPKLEITEHQVGEICCCGVTQRGEFPQNVTATTQYGPRVKAFITMLSIDHKMPMEQISQLFENIYGSDINSSTVIDTLNHAFKRAAPFEKATKQRILEAKNVNFDETGIRVAGKLYWLHTASTADSTHLFVHEKRGKEALESEASVIKDFTGTAVHDCWVSYFGFEESRHTLCGAHLLRELNGLKENGSLWATEMHEFLLNMYKMPREITIGGKEELLAHYHAVLDKADQEEPPPQPSKRGRPKQSKGRNLLNRLRTYSDGVLAFAFEEDVPFTNNQAERDLRGAKVKQKVSGCFRTVKGAEVYARLQAAVLTVRKRGGSVFDWLRGLFLPQKSDVVELTTYQLHVTH